jgi:ribose transport system substrate-binding protein
MEREKLNILVSLTSDVSDFQRAQAQVAEEAAGRLGVGVQVIYAQDDAITQSEQLLKIIQGQAESRPAAIVLQPCGRTGLYQVARSAASEGIGWLVLNWAVDYLTELRTQYKVPAFVVTSDQREIGRIQGRQMEKLLPEGGSILYIQGPSNTPAGEQRTAGMHETKPANIQVRLLKSHSWGEEGGNRAVTSWLRLSTAQRDAIGLIMGQNDLLAMGARQALKEQMRTKVLMFTGVDGLPQGGQDFVNQGLLAATVIVPINAGVGLDMMVKTLRTGTAPKEVTFTVPTSYPDLESLEKAARR